MFKCVTLGNTQSDGDIEGKIILASDWLAK